MGVIPVHDGFSTAETWPFECLHCLHVWEEEYVVRRLNDGHGNDVAVWLRSGLPVQPPWSGATCPDCGCDSVTTFPAGYLSHQPTAGLTPPEPVAVVPDSAPELFVQLPPAPRRPSFMLYALLGISLLLFASFELYERVH
jgi:hypothetical protein